MAEPDFNDYQPNPLPWTETPEEKRLVLKTTAGSLAFFSLVFILFGIILEPNVIKREQLEKIPERLAKVMLQKKALPPPPKPQPVIPKPEPEKPKPIPEPKPEPKKDKPEPKKEEPKKVEPKPQPKEIKEAIKVAKNTGVLSMQNELKALRNSPSLSSLGSTKLRDAKAGSSTRSSSNLIGRRAQQGSGGIQTSEVAKPQRTQLAGRQTTSIKISDAELAEALASNNPSKVNLRTSEEINLVFDQYKAAFYNIYRRSLCVNLGLQGRIVFELKIDPNGQITSCTIVSSELNNPDLERKLRARVLMMEFENRDVKPWQGKYHIDFSPMG